MATSKDTELPPSPGKMTVGPADWAMIVSRHVDTGLRVIMVLVIACIFLGLNYWVVQFIKDVFIADVALVEKNPNAARIVTAAVLQSLIAATVIQVGVATVAIIRYLFPKADPSTD